MTHAEDLAYLDASVPNFEALLRAWAAHLRDLKRDAETRTGDGNAQLRIEQTVKGGHVTRTALVPPPLEFVKRANGNAHE